jgi:hypothetical protein
MRISKNQWPQREGRQGYDDNGKRTTYEPDLLERAVEFVVVVADH